MVLSPEGVICISLGNHHKAGRSGRRKPVHYLLHLTHGVGGGRTRGAKSNALRRLGDIIIADIHIQGHTHTPEAFFEVVRMPDSQYRSIKTQRVAYITTGASVKRGGYAKAFAFPECDRNWIRITLDGKRKHMEIIQ